MEYLRKFALWKEGNPVDEVLDLNSGRPMSIMLGAVLVGKAKAERRRYRRPKTYHSDLKFRLNYHRINATKKIFIDADAIRLMNKLIRSQLTETLYDRINERIGPGITEKSIIYDFMTEVDISDDISFWGLKKRMDRKRQEDSLLQASINQSSCSTAFPPTAHPLTARASSSSSISRPYGLTAMRGCR